MHGTSPMVLCAYKFLPSSQFKKWPKSSDKNVEKIKELLGCGLSIRKKIENVLGHTNHIALNAFINNIKLKTR